METEFLEKYQDYCRSSNKNEELFKIRQGEEESLEDYVDRFNFSLRRYGNPVDHSLARTLLIKGLDKESKQALDLMGKGNINKMELPDIEELCRNYSRTQDGVRSSKTFKGKNEIGQLIKEIANLKIDILVQLNTTLDGIQAKTRTTDQSRATKPLSIYCPRCRNKHLLRECPLDKSEICQIYDREHSTSQCSQLPALKRLSKKNAVIEEELNYVGQKQAKNFPYNQYPSQSSYRGPTNWGNNQWNPAWYGPQNNPPWGQQDWKNQNWQNQNWQNQN